MTDDKGEKKMKCSVCHTDTDNIDPISTTLFPVCVSCIDAKVKEIAARKMTVAYNAHLLEGEAEMTIAEMAEIMAE